MVLNREQNSALLKGLSFIPTPLGFKTQRIELLKDLQDYHRRIKLETFFEGKKSSKKKLPFTHSSDWTPALSSLPKETSKLLTADLYAYKHINWGIKEKTNMSVGERKALLSLQRNRDIVLKPADKGSSTVIMDREQYIFEANRQLAVNEHYRTLQEPIFTETIGEVREILEEMCLKKIISGAQKEYLIGDGLPRPRRLYLLPKIHKEPKNWSIPYQVPPGRPIVSDCNSETYYIAEYLEFFLHPLSIRHPSYLKDTYDFISKIGSLKIPSDALLFTIDIDSLYTNIETTVGLEAVKKFMRKFPDSKRPDDYILKLLEINLTKNDFEFDSKFYLQIKGTAMGKKFAPSYANIFMADWEETALALTEKKPYAYYRFLDDIWGVWTHSMEDFIMFTKFLNAHQASIKIKFTVHESEINFLDVVSYKGPNFLSSGNLDFKVYFKETDTHSLLHKHSFHPKHTFRGIVKSQLLRFKRICTEQNSFLSATNTLFQALRKRGYSRSFLRHTLKTFENPKPLTDMDALSRNKIIPLVSHFSNFSTQLNLAVKSNFLQFMTPTKYLQQHKPIAAYRRNKNISDLLVRSKLSKPFCKGRLGKCKYHTPLLWVKNRFNGQVFKLPHSLSHECVNCIYLVHCLKCRKQYVGQTKNELRVRAYQHAHNIMHKIEKRRHLVQHFLVHGLDSFRITGLQTNPQWSLKERLRAESKWIKRLDTQYPRGLNET